MAELQQTLELLPSAPPADAAGASTSSAAGRDAGPLSRDAAANRRPAAATNPASAVATRAAGPLTLTVSLGNQQEISQNVLRAVARQVREMVVEASGSAARRGVWNYAEQVRVSMGR
jgi:hypothetical protein